MLLVTTKVGPFKSINVSQTVAIDPNVTVLVGMNESGKTVFLQSLEKSFDALGVANFDPVDDYPRKDLPTYLKQHPKNPQLVTELYYRLTDAEVNELNSELHTEVKQGFTFSLRRKYDNSLVVGIEVAEKPVMDALAKGSQLSRDTKAALKKAENLRAIPDVLKGQTLTENDSKFLAQIVSRIGNVEGNWDSVVLWEVWQWLKRRLPKFLYFGEYEILPSKMNLGDLAHRAEQGKTNPKHLEPEHRAVLALLRMADISISDFSKPGGYEPLKAKIEGVSINLTDQIMKFWKQNENLEVEIDIRPDPDDSAPFNSGPNLYLRIKNRRHRGVSTPFRQRSRGFIWFFSFLVWFDSVQHQLESAAKGAQPELLLLLDEPGLSLHALAQADLLRYIDDLSTRHQILYTTHSPFMVHSDRLHQVRVVEDKAEIGTVISDNLQGSDPRTIFPLQAALGWTLAQNLFISARNLLVEGPADLIYLTAVSNMLSALGRTGLRDDVTIVPAGGLDKVATFIALLGASGLELGVLHDYKGTPDARITDLVRQKIIRDTRILNASQFRDLTKIGTSIVPSDLEDLFEVALYLDCFNKSFATLLAGTVIQESDLPPGTRIIDRLERYITTKGITLRPSGGFNHYTVAAYFAQNPPASLHADTLNRFERLFQAVNGLF